jgi:DtxR family Mn-dependent transcriptional regulator
MPDPRLALALYALALALVYFVLRPRRGLWWWGLRRIRRRGDREALEDGLKHLYKSVRFGQRPTLESLAGSLEVSRSRAARLLDTMQRSGLVDADRPLELTEKGRSHALQVIRTHRLWERYLADRTELGPAEWHASAEAREHELDPSEVEVLSARLGHPRYDPHGDPIPTAAGEIPAPIGHALADLPAGAHARIVHIEDEPDTLYQRLLAMGLHPGMQLTVAARDGAGLRLEADGRELVIDPICAANVTVVADDEAPLPDPLAGAETLVGLRPGDEAEVLGLSPVCEGSQRRRLLDLGMVPGTRIQAEFVSASGGAVAYRLRGAVIALRPEQQRWVRIRREGAEAA